MLGAIVEYLHSTHAKGPLAGLSCLICTFCRGRRRCADLPSCRTLGSVAVARELDNMPSACGSGGVLEVEKGSIKN